MRTDFLDVSFHLQSKSYKPFRKPEDTPLYINVRSNHPICIKKKMPRMISEHISSTSSGPNEFNEAAQVYSTALKSSGYKENIGYRKIKAKRKNSRKRNIQWYNPPYSVNVATNVGKRFFQLIDKHFPPHHRLHKIINRNCIKMSCSCMPNIGDIISMHNKATLQQYDKKTKMKLSNATAEIKAPAHLKENAKKGRLYTRQLSRHKINRWYTTGAVKRNSKLGTLTPSKASSLKTKNTPQNSRKQPGMLKMQEKPH